jgi:hypothetical protein
MSNPVAEAEAHLWYALAASDSLVAQKNVADRQQALDRAYHIITPRILTSNDSDLPQDTESLKILHRLKAVYLLESAKLSSFGDKRMNPDNSNLPQRDAIVTSLKTTTKYLLLKEAIDLCTSCGFVDFLPDIYNELGRLALPNPPSEIFDYEMALQSFISELRILLTPPDKTPTGLSHTSTIDPPRFYTPITYLRVLRILLGIVKCLQRLDRPLLVEPFLVKAEVLLGKEKSAALREEVAQAREESEKMKKEAEKKIKEEQGEEEDRDAEFEHVMQSPSQQQVGGSSSTSQVTDSRTLLHPNQAKLPDSVRLLHIIFATDRDVPLSVPNASGDAGMASRDVTKRPTRFPPDILLKHEGTLTVFLGWLCAPETMPSIESAPTNHPELLNSLPLLVRWAQLVLAVFLVILGVSLGITLLRLRPEYLPQAALRHSQLHPVTSARSRPRHCHLRRSCARIHCAAPLADLSRRSYGPPVLCHSHDSAARTRHARHFLRPAPRQLTRPNPGQPLRCYHRSPSAPCRCHTRIFLHLTSYRIRLTFSLAKR